MGGAGGWGGARGLDDTPGVLLVGVGGLAMIDERVHSDSTHSSGVLTRRSSDSLRPVEDYVFHSGDVFTTDPCPPPSGHHFSFVM